MTKHVSRQPAFLLVLVLLVLVLVSTLLLSLSRRSAGQAIEARDAVVDLQRRWGERTLAAALLPDAAHRFARHDRSQPSAGRAPSPAITLSFELGELDFDVTLSDEQAKVNLNALVATGGDRAIDRIRALAPSHVPASAIRLRPAPRATGETRRDDSGDSNDPPIAAFIAWGQVIDGNDPAIVFGSSDEARGLSARLTLWGDGRLSLRRAEREAVAAALGDRLSEAQIRRIIERRDAYVASGVINLSAPLDPTDTNAMDRAVIASWLAAAELSGEDRDAILPRITAESRCYSVAIAAYTPWRRHDSLTVLERVPAGDDNEAAATSPNTEQERVTRFAW